MAKSALQERAEQAAARFRASARRPVVVEFSGTPKAGKTTTLGQVHAFLKRCGFRVEVVVERASVCPIRDKKHFNFNVWTACTTLAQLLEKTQVPPRPDDPEVLLLDRGLFDAIAWLGVMERLARLKTRDRENAEAFLLTADWRKRISGVVVMVSDPDDALRRERGHLPVEGSGGSIMNKEVLGNARAMVEGTAVRLDSSFRICSLDTSAPGFKDEPAHTCEAVANTILDWIEEHLDEHVLYLDKKSILPVFESRASVGVDEAGSLCEAFLQRGEYGPRAAIEADAEKIQALPVVVVRNQSGHILRLKRREARAESPLHEKLVIWAGGHVRSEDTTNGNALLHCATRELHEELRLSVAPDDLALLGAVYATSNERTARHLAIVYEWRAQTDDVAIALCNAEFFERRGTSLSGRFVAVDDLIAEANNDGPMEVWSHEILRNLLVVDGARFSARLFS